MIAVVPLIASAAAAQPASVQKLLDRAVETGARTVRLPQGRVRVSGRLRLQNARRLTVEGAKTTLVFTDHGGVSWSINSCRELILRGFTIDYDPVPFVQGRITARSDDGKRYDFTVADGYPGLSERYRKWYRQGYVFERDRRRWKPWVPDLYARCVEIVDARRGRFVMGYAPARHERIEVGDRLVLTLRAGAAIRMNNCENVRVEDVTFLAAPGCACLGRYMRGDNYFRYTIRPGPPPAGAAEPRLLSTCADGLNVAFATQGPTVERCRFSFMGDDSVNLHGATFAVLEANGPKELLVAWPYGAEWLASTILPGFHARRLRPGSYDVLGTARIDRFEPLKRPTEAQQKVIRTVWPRNRPGRGTVFRLTLREPLAAEPGDFIDVKENNAAGFVIRDCVFEDHRARGLRIMASRGVIEGNTFRRLKLSAITVGAEYGFWREAGWVEDVVIRDNTIEDVGRDAASHSPRAYVLGAISVFVRSDRGSKRGLWPGNRNITIRGNTIRNCPMAGIFVAAARDVRIVGNRLEHVLYDAPKTAGREMQLSVTQPIDARHARNVTVEDNVLTHVGVAPRE